MPEIFQGDDNGTLPGYQNLVGGVYPLLLVDTKDAKATAAAPNKARIMQGYEVPEALQVNYPQPAIPLDAAGKPTLKQSWRCNDFLSLGLGTQDYPSNLRKRLVAEMAAGFEYLLRWLKDGGPFDPSWMAGFEVRGMLGFYQRKDGTPSDFLSLLQVMPLDDSGIANTTVMLWRLRDRDGARFVKLFGATELEKPAAITTAETLVAARLAEKAAGVAKAAQNAGVSAAQAAPVVHSVADWNAAAPTPAPVATPAPTPAAAAMAAMAPLFPPKQATPPGFPPLTPTAAQNPIDRLPD